MSALWAFNLYDHATNSVMGAFAFQERRGGGAFNAKNIISAMQNETLIASALFAVGSLVLLTLPLIAKAVLILKRRRTGAAEVSADLPSDTSTSAKPARARKVNALILSGVVILVLLGGVAYYVFGGQGDIGKAKEQVVAALIDPESARFRDVRTVRDAVCGQVNAKNKLGGYVGFRSFAYYQGSVLIERDSTDLAARDERQAISRICRE